MTLPQRSLSASTLWVFVSVSRFTQSDIDHQKIAYIPPTKDIGSEARLVRFAFTVEDASGNKIFGQTFDIQVSAGYSVVKPHRWYSSS